MGRRTKGHLASPIVRSNHVISPNSNTNNAACPDGADMCDDPHMKGLRGQKIDWSGIDGGWYKMLTDIDAGLHVNVRVAAPLPEESPTAN